MILITDLNPSMDKIIHLDKINIGEYNDGKLSSYIPGGKGIIATSILDDFNEEVFLTGFLGGLNGEYFHRNLFASNIPHEFAQIKEDIRTRIKIIDIQNKITTIIEESPRVTREEVRNFYNIYTKLIERANIICCLGDEQPLGLPDDLYFNLIGLARESRKRIILDIRSKLSNIVVDAIPYMLILDQFQLEGLIGVKLNYKNELIKAGNFLLDKGIKYVVIDLGNKGSMVLGQDKGYILDLPEEIAKNENINGTSTAAGFALGFQRDYGIDMILRLGQAFGIASSLGHRGRIETRDIKAIMGQIEIYPINY